MKDLISEELKRIKKLFGDDLLYGNLNNLNEQGGRYFKKVWDDFLVKSPSTARQFDEVSVRKFTDTNIRSLDDVFKHVVDNPAIWKAIGVTDQEISVMSLLQKNMSKNPGFLFQESSIPGKYFFEFVPIDGGLRGELFYWFSKKYPKEWVEGLRSLPSEQKSKTTNLKSLDNTQISVNTDLPTTLPKVRVDKNGFPLDFKDGKPVDVLGNEVKLLDDGKPDTSLAVIETTDTSNLAPIRVDDEGKAIDFDSNNRPIDTDGDYINLGDDGRPTDPDRPRTDDDYNPVDNSGNPLDEVGKYRKDQKLKFTKTESIFETYIVPTWPGKVKFYQRVIEIMSGADVKTKVIKEFNENINTLVRQTLDNEASGLDIVTLRSRVIDKFMELQKISQKNLSPEFLALIKKRVEDIELEGIVGDEARTIRRRQLNEMWTNLETQDDGLATLFNLMEKDRSLANRPDVRVKKEWRDFWYLDILKSNLAKTDKTFKTYASHIVVTLAKRLWNIFWKQSPYSRAEVQIILSRYGAQNNAILYRELVHQIARRVFQPIIWGTGIYLFYADGKAFGGIRRILEGVTKYDFITADRTDIWKEYVKPQFTRQMGLEKEDFNLSNLIIALTPTWFDETAQATINTFKKSEETKEEVKKQIKITGVGNLKYKPEILEAEYNRRMKCLETIDDLGSLDGWTYFKLKNDSLEPQAKKLELLVRIPMSEDDIVDTKEKLDNPIKEFRPVFELDDVGDLYVTTALDSNYYYVEKKDGSDRTPMIDFLNTFGEKILLQAEPTDKVKSKEQIEKEKIGAIEKAKSDINKKLGKIPETYYRTRKTIMEDTGKKFGEDNFKHWKDTFTFKSEDKNNPGQYKEVKINMEDVMDRIDHFRKKYDEDDAFVRAVIDTHEDVVKIMYTKGLADIRESVTPRGLALVLRSLNESRGEMEIFSVARPANGNWFLVKGDYTQSQLANMDLEKKEPEDKEKKKDVSGSEELKKKEQTAVELLKKNEKEGLNDLPNKVREKLREKLGRGWTTETMPSFLEKFVEKSSINTIFNDKIDIFKLDSNDDTFDAIVDNSSQIFIKRGFCRSLYIASDKANLNEKQQKVVDHILDKCDKKFLGKLGVRNF